MKYGIFLSSAAFAALVSLGAFAADTTGSGGGEVKFTACPVLKEVESNRCWVATSGGVTYDLSQSSTEPHAGLKVRVVGTVSSEADTCQTGTVLKPVTVTVLRTRCKPPAN